MFSYKENVPPHQKAFYPPRPNTGNLNLVANKIHSKPGIPESNYGRSVIPTKPLTLRNSFSNEPSTSFARQSPPDYVSDAYGMGSFSTQNVRYQTEYEPGHFRPRKSILGKRMSKSTFEYTGDTKISNFDWESATPESSKTIKFLETSQELRNFQIKPRQNLLHLFTGSVENLMQWSKLRNSLHILFEVTATVISFQQGHWKSEKCFWLSDSKSGGKLQVLFYEIDRPLPKLRINSLVTCTGRLLTRNRLQAYKVEESSEEQKNDLERLSFICNRVADEIVANTQKK